MSEIKPMKIMILEDDIKQIDRFSDTIKRNNDFELVYFTSSTIEAINYIKNNEVEGIIVDLELNNGEGGSGYTFINNLYNIELSRFPIVFVTTQLESKKMFDTAHRLKVDFVFCKNKENYSPNIVLEEFLNYRPSYEKQPNKITKYSIETEIERKKRMNNLIKDELNLIGIPPHLKGWTYLVEAIGYLIENKDKAGIYYSNHLQEIFNIRKAGINSAIQDAINNAWRHTPDEILLQHFKANAITFKNGTPTPEQFIHYYMDKIINQL